MIFNKHSNLEGKHALLGGSKYYWINDETKEDKLKRIRSFYISDLGTALHAVAQKRIKYGFKLTKHDKKSVIIDILEFGIPEIVIRSVDFDLMFDNLQTYVNDAIGFKMEPEQILYYSDYCFGTADAISFRDGYLRIHDLKTGLMPAHIEQLEVYVALFCLEYKIKPIDIKIELRIYQNNEIIIHNPEVDEIVPIIDQIISYNKFFTKIQKEE